MKVYAFYNFTLCKRFENDTILEEFMGVTLLVMIIITIGMVVVEMHPVQWVTVHNN